MSNNISSLSKEEFTNKVKEFLQFKDAVKSHAYRILRNAGKIEQSAIIEEVDFYYTLDDLVVIKVYQNTCHRIYKMSFSEFIEGK